MTTASPPEANAAHGRRAHAWMSAATAGAGLSLLWLSSGIDADEAPRGVVALVGAVFLGAAVALWPATRRLPRWMSAVATLVIVGGLCVLANWVAFGPGLRACTGAFTGWLPFAWASSDMECRIAFGFGALLLNGVVLYGACHALAKRFPASRALALAEKAAVLLILLPLAPLLLLGLGLSLLTPKR